MRILLAEDEKDLAGALALVLIRNNYSVDTVYNGEDALWYLQNGEYDAAVLDIMMPIRDGISVLRELRSSGSDIPVLLLTARSQIDDRVEGLDAGADDYLTKPFAMKELLARLRAITRRTGGHADNVITFADLSLDTGNYTLAGPAGSVRMVGREYGLIKLLFDNVGTVVSAQRIFDKVWGYDADADVNGVWVYISNLRKKLAGIGSCVKIHSMRNLGYMLEADSGKETET